LSFYILFAPIVFLLLFLFRVLNLGSISIKINNPKTENQNSKTNPINHPGHTRKINSNFIPIRPNSNPNPNKVRSHLSFDQINHTKKSQKSSSPISANPSFERPKFFEETQPPQNFPHTGHDKTHNQKSTSISQNHSPY